MYREMSVLGGEKLLAHHSYRKMLNSDQATGDTEKAWKRKRNGVERFKWIRCERLL